MASEIFTYSIMEEDSNNLELVDRIKSYVKPRGITMSWIILQALKNYEQSVLNEEQTWQQHLQKQRSK